MPAPTRSRPGADACPGVLSPHDAADGALARVRLPGGQVGAAALRVLASCAEDLGDGNVHLTSRGNLQLRGLDRTDREWGGRLAGCGLLPSPTHERVRNILASPLSGIAGGHTDVRPLARALDAALCARPALAALPGRFLFALDDGRADVAAEEPDLCWQALGPDLGAVLVAGVDTGVRTADPVRVLLAAAEAFLQVRGTAWRVAEIPDAPALLAAHLDPRVAPDRHPSCAASPPGSGWIAPGPVPRDDGGSALVVAPVLGELTAAQVRAVADAAPAVVITPWRSIVVPDAVAIEGLPGDPAGLLSACVGRPGCAKALADVRADARRMLPQVRERTHVCGCERRCGAPRGQHVAIVATTSAGTGGYR